jgi:hypothetical protein
VETIALRVCRAVEAGASALSQLVTIGVADDVLVGLYHAARKKNLSFLVHLPSGEIVDIRASVLRPATSVSGFIADSAI